MCDVSMSPSRCETPLVSFATSHARFPDPAAAAQQRSSIRFVNCYSNMSEQQAGSGSAVPAVANGANDPGTTPSAEPGPSRFIFTPIDMEAFKASPAKRDLLGFATAMGRSCASAGGSGQPSYRYEPTNPLVSLSPATASLHGSLRQMAEHWMQELPPDGAARARFGNPVFRKWHERLVNRSENIVRSMLECHREHGFSAGGAPNTSGETTTASAGEYSMEVLQSCSESGYTAAASDEPVKKTSTSNVQPTEKERQREETIIVELRAYLHQAFGHPTRLDYGTGHESSFLIVIFCLCKLRCIGDGKTLPPSPRHLAPVALAVFSQYLQVTRGLQRDYMLEPAGSHGVWGLDDYHCLPFYFGACQLQAEEDGSGSSSGDGDEEAIVPRSIHDNALLNCLGKKYMYLGCIRYIKELKSSVPFFESSPMLDDISQLPSWGRVSRGLLRLYDGEVLTKLPVVQHFLFGTLFQATWTPSAQPREAPERTFINGPGGEECIAPWAQAGSAAPAGSGGSSDRAGGSVLPPTRAPWAK